MPINRPFHRTYRPYVSKPVYSGGTCNSPESLTGYVSSSHNYITHPKFAVAPEHYVRAFLLIQKDLRELFDYIEPADTNLDCYSYRIHALLLRTCVEFEANCKAILTENNYSKSSRWNIWDYKKINHTHRLSSYKVRIPVWSGEQSTFTPFVEWATDDGKLPWYEAYNASKHDRYKQFGEASFRHLLNSVCALLVVLSAQFEANDFAPETTLNAIIRTEDGMTNGIGDFFRIQFPQDWPEDQKYDFVWESLMNEATPFQHHDYK